MKVSYLIMFLLVLIVIPLVSSAPPVTTVGQFPNGYVIEEIPHQILKVNTDFIYYFYLYNSSNGIRIDNSSVNCTFNMVDSQGVFLTSQIVSYMGSYWTTTINGSYFDEVGSYYYGIDCQDGLGGALAGGFEVRLTKEGVDTGEVIKLLGFLLIGILTSMFLYIKISRIMGSIVVLIIGVGMTWIAGDMGWVGIIVMITGLIMIVYSAFTPKKTRKFY